MGHDLVDEHDLVPPEHRQVDRLVDAARQGLEKGTHGVAQPLPPRESHGDETETELGDAALGTPHDKVLSREGADDAVGRGAWQAGGFGEDSVVPRWPR